MTYKKKVPDFVFNRWKHLNPEYRIDFSLDNDCIHFLKNYFNDNVVNLFNNIERGMYKADLWRLCKLYMEGGVYSDIDIVPHLNINSLNKEATFFSCIAADNNSIFQAFIVNNCSSKSPLILAFLISFFVNNPYLYCNGPTYDMYNCLTYNINENKLKPDHMYEINDLKIKIVIGNSKNKIKKINLYYFPNDVNYIIKLNENPYNDEFSFKIENNELIVERINIQEDNDNNNWENGWGHDHSCNLHLKCIEKTNVSIGNSKFNKKIIDLSYISKFSNSNVSIRLNPNPYNDNFDFKIENNQLIVTRININEDFDYKNWGGEGWGHPHSCEITYDLNPKIILFKESCEGHMVNSLVTHNNYKILDSRDPKYHYGGGW